MHGRGQGATLLCTRRHAPCEGQKSRDIKLLPDRCDMALVVRARQDRRASPRRDFETGVATLAVSPAYRTVSSHPGDGTVLPFGMMAWVSQHPSWLQQLLKRIDG